MGFAVYYRSTEPLTDEQADAVEHRASALCAGRTWLSCEPVILANRGGHLEGASKPNFDPADVDIAAAEQEGLPDGDLSDAVDVLRQLSREHGVDWELGHDYGALGFIRAGDCDANLLAQVEAIAGACGMLGGISDESEHEDFPDDDRDDDHPHILRFPLPSK